MKLEDTREDHLEQSVAALDRLTAKTGTGSPRAAVVDRGQTPGSDPSRTAAVVAGLAVGGCLTWNVSNVGAVADPLSVEYGVSIVAIGVLLANAIRHPPRRPAPAGRGADRFGARAVALVAIGTALVGNGVLLIDDSFGAALSAVRSWHRLGSRLRRRARPRPGRRRRSCSPGLYGGATMAGGGLALMVVPSLTDATSWRAAYWSAAILAAAAAVPAVSTGPPTDRARGPWIVRDLLPDPGRCRPRRSGSPSSRETGSSRSWSARARALLLPESPEA